MELQKEFVLQYVNIFSLYVADRNIKCGNEMFCLSLCEVNQKKVVFFLQVLLDAIPIECNVTHNDKEPKSLLGLTAQP